jgi:hypothetical protein
VPSNGQPRPTSYAGVNVPTLDGRGLLPILAGESSTR